MHEKHGFGSLCVRDPKSNNSTRPHQLPIVASSSFVLDSIDEAIQVFKKEKPGHVYSRYGNPTQDTVASKITRLETYALDMEAQGYLVSSGMSAISTLMMACLKQGDKLLTQGNLYGGTTELFLKVLKPLGITPIFTDLKQLENVEQLLADDPSIKMLYFETPANPTLACVDMQALTDVAKRYGCLTAVDNTFCTPYLQQPFAFGLDFIIHSTTKFLNGHGNSIAGILIGKDVHFMKTRVWEVLKLAGTNCNPWDAWLINNGLKTLELRMERHSSNALQLARYLEQHSAVNQVNYTGLPNHPDHELATRQMKNFGGMLSFELKGGLEAGMAFMRKLQFCTLAPTLGDVDTLVLHPVTSSHLNVDPEVRQRNGITDGLIRLSVGIETVEDIQADLQQALEELQ